MGNFNNVDVADRAIIGNNVKQGAAVTNVNIFGSYDALDKNPLIYADPTIESGALNTKLTTRFDDTAYYSS